MADNILKQIKIGSTVYELDVKYLDGHTWAEIPGLVNKAQFIVATSAATTPEGITWMNGTTEVVGTKAASSSAAGEIYLVKHTHTEGPTEKDIYDEYVAVGSGTSAVWEKIGNTDIDLAAYSKKGTETKPASGNTASGGAATIDTGSAGSTSGVGSISFTYSKAPTITGAAVGGSSSSQNTGENGAHGHTFTGTKATITITSSGSAVENGGHTHEVTPTSESVVQSVTGTPTTISSAPATTGDESTHTHSISVATHEHGATNVTAITGVGADGTANAITGVGANGTASAITGLGGSQTTVLTGVTISTTATVLTGVKITSSASAMNATVSGNVLELSTVSGLATGVGANGTAKAATAIGSNGTANAYTAFSPTSATVLTGVKATSTATVLKGVKATSTASVASAPSAKTITATSGKGGAHKHTISGTSVTVLSGITSTPTTVLSGVSIDEAGAHQHSVSVSGSTTYTPAGSLNAVDAHTHTYTKPASHTHSITLASETITKDISVAVGAHVHSVSLPAHVHGLNSHTHEQQ